MLRQISPASAQCACGIFEPAERELGTDTPKVRDGVKAKRHWDGDVLLIPNRKDQAAFPHELRRLVIIESRSSKGKCLHCVKRYAAGNNLLPGAIETKRLDVALLHCRHGLANACRTPHGRIEESV